MHCYIKGAHLWSVVCLLNQDCASIIYAFCSLCISAVFFRLCLVSLPVKYVIICNLVNDIKEDKRKHEAQSTEAKLEIRDKAQQ